MKNIPFKAYSIKEEVGNSITHGLMAVVMLLFLPYASIRAGTLTVENKIKSNK